MATSNSSNDTTTEPSPLHQDLLPPTTNHLQVEEEECLEDAVEVTESADVLEGNKILSSHIDELEGEDTDHSCHNNNTMSAQNEVALLHHTSAPAKIDISHERQQEATEEPLPESAPSLTVDPTATETNDTTTIPHGDKHYQKDNKFQTKKKKKKGKPRINWLMHFGSLFLLALTVLIIVMLVRSLQTHNKENGESKSTIATDTTTNSTLSFGNDNETTSPTEVSWDDDEIDHSNETIHNISEIPVSTTEMPSTTSSPSQETTFTNTNITTGDEETFTEAPINNNNTTDI